MDGHDDARRALGQPERGALELGQAAVGDAAEFLDEPAMKSKIRSQHPGDGEREMPVRHGCQDGLGQQRTEKLHLLLVARRAEPSPLARERQQMLAAAKEAMRGKRSRPPAARFFARWETEAMRLREELLDGSYRPSLDETSGFGDLRKTMGLAFPPLPV